MHRPASPLATWAAQTCRLFLALSSVLPLSRPRAVTQTYFTFDLSGEALRVQRRIYGLTPEPPGEEEAGDAPGGAGGPPSPSGAGPTAAAQVGRDHWSALYPYCSLAHNTCLEKH